MRPLRCIIAAALLLSAFAVTEVSAKRKMVPQVYMFGFAASFTDSIVYMTNVQTVDSVWIDSKTKFLQDRNEYSYQLKNFFTYKLNMNNRTCMVFFGTKKSDVEKKYLKMKRKYTDGAKNKYDVRYLEESDFRFEPIKMELEEEQQPEVKVKKTRKEEKRRGRGTPGKPGGPEGGHGGPEPR